MGSIIAFLIAKLSQESPILTMSAARRDVGPTFDFLNDMDRSEKMFSKLPRYFTRNLNLRP